MDASVLPCFLLVVSVAALLSFLILRVSVSPRPQSDTNSTLHKGKPLHTTALWMPGYHIGVEHIVLNFGASGSGAVFVPLPSSVKNPF